MLNSEKNKILQNLVFERIDVLYSRDVEATKFNNTIAKVAAQAAIITLQEYEKLNSAE